MEDQIKCPKCLSTQISANKTGFSGTKAIAGNLLVGPAGLLAGVAGSNKIKLTCLKCGNQFNPGDNPIPMRTPKEGDIYVWIFAVVCFIAAFILMIAYLAKSWK